MHLELMTLASEQFRMILVPLDFFDLLLYMLTFFVLLFSLQRSNERKKMTKRLTEEALAYFDECVSISTFDSSDFSAPENPSHNSVGAATTTSVAVSALLGSPSAMPMSFPVSYSNYKQVPLSI